MKTIPKVLSVGVISVLCSVAFDATAEIEKGAIIGTRAVTVNEQVPSGEIWEITASYGNFSVSSPTGGGISLVPGSSMASGVLLAPGDSVHLSPNVVSPANSPAVFVTRFRARRMVDAEELTKATNEIALLKTDLKKLQEGHEQTRIQWIQNYGSNMQSVINLTVTNVVDSTVRARYEQEIAELKKRVVLLEKKK